MPCTNVDCVARTQNLYKIEWYERKGKRNDNWGHTPAFKLTIAGYTKQRKAYPTTSVEPFSAFIPVHVQLVASSTNAEPKLTKACMTALRSAVKGKDSAGTSADNAMNEEASEEEDEEIRPAKQSKKRKRVITDPD